MSEIYLIGSGIASLASAVFLIRDAHIPGKNIHIFEELPQIGGALDAHMAYKGVNKKPFFYFSGGRMFEEEAYRCMYNLMSTIPSLSDKDRTLLEEFRHFNREVKTYSRRRLFPKKTDEITTQLSWTDKINMLKLLLTPETLLGNKTIRQSFSESFFKTDFWYMWRTTFAFQEWHSAMECRRYLKRFVQEFPKLNTLAGVRRTPYNQIDSLVRPILKYLKSNNVNLNEFLSCKVTDLAFKDSKSEKVVSAIYYEKEGKSFALDLKVDDFVFITNGSMTEDKNFNFDNQPAKLITKPQGAAWTLWENLAKKHHDFGNPHVFCGDIEKTKWQSFTMTFYDNNVQESFIRKLYKITDNIPGTGALITFRNSSWLMSIVLAYQPHFDHRKENFYNGENNDTWQPANLNNCWGYGLFPDQIGDKVKKKMSACTGEEIMEELAYHLGLEANDIIYPSGMDPNLKTECVTCMMPYITAQFMPRKLGDRPLVVPKGSKNLAFIGQFCEMPQDVVFTVEYSCRSAMTAVYKLFKVDKKITPIYDGARTPLIIRAALR